MESVEPLGSNNLVITSATPLESNTVYTIEVQANYLQKQPAAVTWSFTTGATSILEVATGSVYATNRKLHVSNYELGTSVSVYTVAGNLLTTQKVADTELVIDLAQGAYIVNVRSEGKTAIHKILVK